MIFGIFECFLDFATPQVCVLTDLQAQIRDATNFQLPKFVSAQT